MTREASKLGTVCLVGAGPGDPGLITVAGLERLRRADIVVYDALANPRLLDETPPQAQRIDVGKRAGQHKLAQDRINALLLDHARQGRFVVRLKGGDPYLFGRGAEEAAYLGWHGIDVEVIPGVTAGIAAPAAAGIPVTHREHASTVTFVTGHEDPTKPDTSIDYAALAKLIAAGGTACFYMGVGRLRAICGRLAGCGLTGQTPVGVVQWGTLPRQRQLRSTLDAVADAVSQGGLGAPAIVVVGAVAAMDEAGLNGFVRRPLFGQTVLVTRTRTQASVLGQQLEAMGAAVLEAPTIELVAPTRWTAVDDALGRLDQYRLLILTSRNAVDVLADRMKVLGHDARALAGLTLATVGPATTEALLHRLAVRADLTPQRSHGEALAAAILDQLGHEGRAMLLRADIARPVLADRLTRAGWSVDRVVAYHTQPAPSLPEPVLAALREQRLDWVTFTSASTARNLAKLLEKERGLLDSVRIASIGPITSEAIETLGLTVTVEADTPTISDLVMAMARWGTAADC